MATPVVRTKGSAYALRNLASIPSPLEADSDSDFNEKEVFIPEPKKTRKRRNTSGKHSLPPADAKGKRRRQANSQPRPSRTAQSAPQNPLLQYFNASLGLHSASEDESDDGSLRSGLPRDRQSEDKGDEDERDPDEVEEDDPVVVSRALVGYKESPTAQAQINKAQEDSDTEPESDTLLPVLPSTLSIPSHRALPHNERLKVTIAGDGSETETESDSELEPFVPPAHLSRSGNDRPMFDKAKAPEGSSTESDSEPDTHLASLHPRPVLPLPEGTSRRIGPLILDAESGIMVPNGINTFLREYQRDGVRFFWERWREGRGGLLGDDMGLGKTIQVISFLSALMRKAGDVRDVDRRRKYVSDLQDQEEWRLNRVLPKANAKWPTCLIICPSQVVGNWRREFDTWGYFEVGLYTESKKERKEVLRDFELGRLDILISTPNLARTDIELLCDLAFSCIIIDEVHNVKNPLSKTSRAFNMFQCTVRFGLTGTAIQNDYMELWTILDWTHPGMLGTKKQWKGYVAKPLKLGQSRGSSEEERSKAIEVATILKDKLLPIFFLRRTKDIIKDQLPAKVDQVVFCPLTPTQIAVYKRILNIPAVQNIVQGFEPCDCGSKERRKSCCHAIGSGDILRYIAVLLKLSNHLALLLPSPTDSLDQMERNRILSRIAFPGGNIPKFGPAMMQPKYCGKWMVLETLLQKWREDRTNKVLIFTKSVKLLNMLEYHLSCIGYIFVKLEGATPKADRMKLIDQFHNDPEVFIFLISTTVGGTGLNLQCANRVVIFDPNWNPAHDLQAMDRAYRFGQTRDVHVYRLLGAGSLEELIYARQVYKQQQMAIGYSASIQTRYFDGVQGDAEKQGELFGVHNIFKLHEDKLATKQAIEKANIADLDWALANMSGGKPRKKKSTDSGVELAYEVDAKGGKEEGDLRGLGSLLFDDEPPALPSEDEISQALNAIGVRYSHQNDLILQPSNVEQVRASDALKRRKAEARAKRARAPKGAAIVVEAWPPRRSRLTPDERLANRQHALIGLGMIAGPEHMSTFAQEFNRKSLEEQNEILAQLDKYA